jgi:hypothetical protein
MKRIIAITTLAATLLLGGTAHAGWYLLRPPVIDIDDRHAVVHPEWPLWTWDSSGSYDTAAECRTALDNDARQTFQTIQFMKDKLKDDPPLLSHSINNMLLSIGSMQCVATDDPRLNRR